MCRLVRIALLLVGLVAVTVAAQSQTVYSTPAVMFRSVPAYPPIARAAKATGTINVDVSVAADGTVLSATATDGHPLLRRAAEVSARGWQFVPAMASDVRIVRLAFTFLLSSKSNDDLDVAATFVTPYHIEITRAPNLISDPPFVLRKKRKRAAHRGRTQTTAQPNKSLDARLDSLFLN
jgi:TonB family protein